MNNLKRVLMLTMCAAILAGCGKEKAGNEDAISTGGGKNQITDKAKDLSLFLIQEGQSWKQDSIVGRKAFEDTNVNLITHSSSNNTDENQAFNLMVASGDMPDIIASGSLERMDKLGVDGGLVPLTDMIEKNAPNIKAFFDEYPDFERVARSADGEIYAIPNYYDYYNMKIGTGFFIRTDWLKALNLDMPETMGELYDVLVAFRDEDPNKTGKKDTVPFFSREQGLILDRLVSLFGAHFEFYVDEGEVKFGPLDTDYKAAVASVNKWYGEGLIDREIFTRGWGAREALLTPNLGGATVDWFGSTASFNEILKDTVDGFEFMPMAPPVIEGDKRSYIFARPIDSDAGWGVSSTSKSPELAVKYLDYWFSEEGRRLWNFGVEGIHYNVVEGVPVFTDYVIKNEDGDNPLKVLRNDGAQLGRMAAHQDYDYEKGWLNKVAISGYEMYQNNGYATDPMPKLKYTDEELKEVSRIMSRVKLYQDEMTQKWVMGVADVNKDYDEFTKRIENLGIGEVLKISQRAYDRVYK